MSTRHMSKLRTGLNALMLIACVACDAPASRQDLPDGELLPLDQGRETPPLRPRLLILTDIGGDPDDTQSLVRLLHYANEFDIEGLIATSTDRDGGLTGQVRPELIRSAIEAYGAVQSRLAQHANHFPEADRLIRTIAEGNARWGIEAVGPGQDTPASSAIIEAVDRAPDVLNVSIWGGQTDFAQALWRVRADRTPAQVERFVARLRVHDIDDQDGLFLWITRQFPGLWYLLNRAQNGVSCDSVFRGMFRGGDMSTVTRAWIRTRIKRYGTPLTELYPDDGIWTCRTGIHGVKEGDTPSWFYFLSNGLQDPSEPTWGGWGGRYRLEGSVYRDSMDQWNGDRSRPATVNRWRDAFQRSFEARIRWSVLDPAEANHDPQVVVDGQTGERVRRFRARPGRRVSLDASGSFDPDGDDLTFHWWIYREPTTFARDVHLNGARTSSVTLDVPRAAAGTRIHLILELTDDGEPPLTSFQRFVIYVDR